MNLPCISTPGEQRSRFLGLTERAWKIAAAIKGFGLGIAGRRVGLKTARSSRDMAVYFRKVAQNFGQYAFLSAHEI
jgi:hypothetical protein